MTAYTAQDPADIAGPVINYVHLLPLLIIFGAAIVGVLIEALLPRGGRYPLQVTVSLGGIVAAFGAVLYLAGDRKSVV